MVKYKVVIDVSTSVESEWKDWMKTKHIRDVINTGCFYDFSFTKINSNGKPMPAGYARYEIEYLSRSLEIYQTYLDKYAQPLRDEHTAKYKGSVEIVSRDCYEFEDIF